MNYSELTEAVVGYLEEIDEDSFIARMDDFVIQAEQQILRALKSPELRIQQVESTVLVQGSNEASLPDPYLEILGVSISQTLDPLNEDDPAPTLPGVQVKPLRRVDTSYIREAYRDRSLQGVPYHYAIQNRARILIGPTPDYPYPLIFDYTAFPESITTAGRTWLGDNAEQVFLYGTLVSGYTYLKGEPDILQGYQAIYDRELMLLMPEGDDAPVDQKVATQ